MTFTLHFPTVLQFSNRHPSSIFSVLHGFRLLPPFGSRLRLYGSLTPDTVPFDFRTSFHAFHLHYSLYNKKAKSQPLISKKSKKIDFFRFTYIFEKKLSGKILIFL